MALEFCILDLIYSLPDIDLRRSCFKSRFCPLNIIYCLCEHECDLFCFLSLRNRSIALTHPRVGRSSFLEDAINPFFTPVVLSLSVSFPTLSPPLVFGLPLLLSPLTALTYAGLMTAGPFFVSRDKDVGLGGGAVVLDVDKMACYVAEKVVPTDVTPYVSEF